MDAFMGMVATFGFSFAPRGWALCQGQMLPIAQNQALFALLGTTYGGNGVTTFQLPDLRGRTMLGPGQGPGLNNYILGEQTGVENVSLTIANLPSHTHAATATSTSTSTSTSTLNGENTTASAPQPGNKVLASSTAHEMYLAPTGNTKAMAAESVATTTTTTTNTTVTIGPTGGNVPVPVLQPSLCVNYCICLEGLFPSRN